ncbi:MAG TPA: DUF6049 family protein, partial [Streptosporangiaceae bacterium]|nr:DUF6049 family protein [Streptosporangiaceae bacterium]
MPRPLLTRSAARAIAALCGVAPCVLALSGLTLSEAAASVAGARQPGVTVPVSVSITSVSPDFARPGRPVTVSGILTNISHKAITGLSVQLRSSQSAFGSRGALQEYADGISSPDSPLNGAVTDLTRPLPPRATVRWSITLGGNQLPMTVFGVYPLAAQATSADQTPLAVSRTFLPFWTGQQSLGDPLRQDVAWIWPLIDQPRQAICPALLNNGLAASFGSGGRLAGLLEAGRAYSTAARLTWAIDPGLLANATTMSKPYHAGGVAGCHGSSRQPQPRAESASRAATAWLAGLKSATAGQQVFVTPYDDADIAALTRYGLNADLSHAFTEGRLVAGQALGRSFSATAGGTAASTNAVAWPADGSANRADLVNLAASDGIKTVVLDSSAMPPSSPQVHYTASAQTTTRDGRRSGMTVLLSDDTLTQIIGSANSASDSPAQKFSIEQRYLAETAMIAAEQPGVARSVVIAPPRHWDPPADLASSLLDETVRAPWLQPVSLATLAAVKHPAGGVRRQAPPETVSGARLGRSLVSQVR